MSKRDKITARLRLQFGVTVVFLAIAAHDGLAIPSVRSPEIHPDLHTIMFSMREDGFEFDKWLMTTEPKLEIPTDAGPAEKPYLRR